MARIITLQRENIGPDMEAAARILLDGGLVIFPTETFYGIAADHTNADALSRLAELKGREEGKPMALILSQRSEVESLAAEVTAKAKEFMARHWPGPLTLVFEAKAGLDPRLVSADGGVGMRLSPHPVAAGLALALGRAITATSANPAGGPAVARVEDLDPQVADGVDLILDWGECPGGMASTVVDVRCDPPLILRPGPVGILAAQDQPG